MGSPAGSNSSPKVKAQTLSMTQHKGMPLPLCTQTNFHCSIHSHHSLVFLFMNFILLTGISKYVCMGMYVFNCFSCFNHINHNSFLKNVLVSVKYIMIYVIFGYLLFHLIYCHDPFCCCTTFVYFFVYSIISYCLMIY